MQTQADVLSKIESVIQQFVELHSVPSELCLPELGLDSLDIVEFALELESTFEIEISEELIEKMSFFSVKQISETIYAIVNPQPTK
jgi:acyl carrier protein